MTSARLVGAAVASFVLHAALAAMLPSESKERVAPPARPVSEIEFAVLEPNPRPPVPSPDLPAEPRVASTASLRPETASTRPEPAAAIEPPASAIEPPASSSPVEPSTELPAQRPEDGQDAPERPITVPGGLRIDPRAVALGALSEGPRPRTPQPSDGPAPESAEARDARLNAQHSRFLATVGNRRDYVTRREPPDLRRRPDGSYLFRGSAFSARILPDGTVQFSDRNNVRFGGLGGPADSLGGTVRFDITDALERRAGNDPYRAERRWFLEETEELRERLGTEHRTRTAARETRSLRGSLERIWADATKPSVRRRASLFRVWDDLAEDETGMPMRRAVLTFIRARLPAGSPEAYTPDELAALNRGRQSEEAFVPY